MIWCLECCWLEPEQCSLVSGVFKRHILMTYLFSLTENWSIVGSGVLCFVLWVPMIFIRGKVCLGKKKLV